ncbi:hypothetical protein AWENTII_002577 [Aspergillus wentii]
MDSKRKSSCTSPANHQYKRVKIDHLNDSSQERSTKVLSVKQDEARSRLDLLRKLVREINDSHQSFQHHAAEAGSDIMLATAELDKAFRLPRNSPSLLASPSIYCPEKPREISEEASSGHEREHSLPKLPPIVDPFLEKAVFTHPGVSNDTKGSYDRLEILGDAYIELMATKLIWNRFQELPSGRISQIRELLVKNETLSEYATSYGFDRRASVPHDYLTQPRRWTKTKGDIFEAYVAAIILSDQANGYRQAEEWLTQLWLPKIAGFGVQASDMQGKEALAKQIMGKGIKLKYVDEKPPLQLGRGMQRFFIGVYLTGWGWTSKHLGSGQGLNKTAAGDEAARQALLNESLINEIVAKKKACR